MSQLNTMPSVPTSTPSTGMLPAKDEPLVRVQDLDKPAVPQKNSGANSSTQSSGRGSLDATLPKKIPSLKANDLAGTASVQLISGPDFFTATQRGAVSGKWGDVGWNAGVLLQQRDPVSPKGTFSSVLGFSFGIDKMLFDDKTTSLKGALNFGLNRIFVDNNKPGGDLWQFSPGASLTLNHKFNSHLQWNTALNATFTRSLVNGGRDWSRLSLGGETGLKLALDKSKAWSVSLGINGQTDLYEGAGLHDQSAFGPFLRVSLNKDPITVSLEGRYHAQDTITNPGVPFWGNGGQGDFSIGGSLNFKF
jgi:hypothetical protein